MDTTVDSTWKMTPGSPASSPHETCGLNDFSCYPMSSWGHDRQIYRQDPPKSESFGASQKSLCFADPNQDIIVNTQQL